ncbi:hypothetical protein JCM10212_002355 [Sporobolomyces blumeae]
MEQVRYPPSLHGHPLASDPTAFPTLAQLHHPVPQDPPTHPLDPSSLKKHSKPKDLSHVPCKFYKANSCTAGASCPFSHDLVNPGQSKPICQWFAKGNCKFGHKCALAHVLPGQPMSFDRKNKRAAQAALREAQAGLAAGAGSGAVGPTTNGTIGANGDAPLVNTTNAVAQSPGRHPAVDGHRLVQTLKQSVDSSTAATGTTTAPRAYLYNGVNGNGGVGLPTSGGSGDADAIFGSPDSVGRRTPASSPGLQHRGLPFSHDAPTSPLSFAAIAHGGGCGGGGGGRGGGGATFSSPPPPSSSLSHHLLAGGGGGANGNGNGRSSVAAQAMLSEQARRLSSTSQSLSPPRLGHHASYHLSGSVPLAVPVPGAVTASASYPTTPNGTGIFGTSPFSGSRGLFMPSSYDSNDGDAFPRSPPVLHRSNSHSYPSATSQRRGSSTMSSIVNVHAHESALDDDGDDVEDDPDEGYDEGFLPSSLNDLLTPEEMRRRTLKARSLAAATTTATTVSLSTSSSSFSSSSFPVSPPSFPSQSVPADLLLSNGKPSSISATSLVPPAFRPSSVSSQSPSPWGLVPSSSEGHNPSAVPFTPPQSLLSASRGLASSSHSGPGSQRYLKSIPAMSSASFNDATMLFPSGAGGGASGGDSTTTPALSPSRPFHPAPYPYQTSLLSPTTEYEASLIGVPGGSLPGGLAAGLSRLHLDPLPGYTGETPPTSVGTSTTGLDSFGVGSGSSDGAKASNGGARGMSYSQALGSSPRAAPATLTGPSKIEPGGAGGRPGRSNGQVSSSSSSSSLSLSQAKSFLPPTSTSSSPFSSFAAAAASRHVDPRSVPTTTTPAGRGLLPHGLAPPSSTAATAKVDDDDRAARAATVAHANSTEGSTVGEGSVNGHDEVDDEEIQFDMDA